VRKLGTSAARRGGTGLGARGGGGGGVAGPHRGEAPMTRVSHLGFRGPKPGRKILTRILALSKYMLYSLNNFD
jgi:hypothetical protein